MEKNEFYKFLDDCYKLVQQNSVGYTLYQKDLVYRKVLGSFSEETLREVNKYVLKNYDTDILIQIFGYEVKKDKIILKTELGTFLLDIKDFDVGYIEERLNELIQKKLNLLQFCDILFNNDIFYQDDYIKYIKYSYRFISISYNESDEKYLSSDIMLLNYLKAYVCYKRLLGEKVAYSFYSHFVQDYNYSEDRSVPLEILSNKDFNRFICKNFATYSTKRNFQNLNNVYENYYSFDDNIELLFFLIVMENKNGKLDFIKSHIAEFKEFILERFSNHSSEHMNFISKLFVFLNEGKLLDYFNKGELKQLYLENPTGYFVGFDGKYLDFVDEFENNSPIIRLNSNSETMVHIKYHNYDFFDGKPIDFIKRKFFKNEMTFLDVFLCNNESVVKFYKAYYKGYLKIIKDDPDKNNLEDFIKMLLKPNNLINVFSNNKFGWDDLDTLAAFTVYYGDEKGRSLIEKVRKDLRNKNLKIFNEIVLAKNRGSLEELEACLNKYELDRNGICSYIIENKFLYSKEKGALLNIINSYYDLSSQNYSSSLRVLDVLLLLDEMLEKGMTIDEILKEKALPKKEFYEIYQSSIDDNPILYQCIFEHLSKNKKRGYIKLIRFGYKVINTELNSLKEYNEQFDSVISFEKLLIGLENTSLYVELIEKAKLWSDFNLAQVKVKKRNLLNKI